VGVVPSTLRRAATRLGVKKVKNGRGARLWRLPDENEPAQ
jgi:hypothetical protein